MKATRHAQGGYGLYEAMLSLLVVSVGFLGFSGLQMKGLTNANSSLLRSKAVDLAYQMTDRARANVAAAQAGSYNALTGAPSNPGCIASACTTAQMVQNDYFEWRADVAAALPSGVGAICLDSTPDDGTPGDPQCDNAGTTLAVKIWWSEKSRPTPYLFVNPFRP